jgi:hypothetical protein
MTKGLAFAVGMILAGAAIHAYNHGQLAVGDAFLAVALGLWTYLTGHTLIDIAHRRL